MRRRTQFGLLWKIGAVLAAALIIPPSMLWAQSGLAIHLEVFPAAEPEVRPGPPLLPPVTEQTTGNAAVYYGKVKAMADHVFGSAEFNQKLAAAGSQPTGELHAEPQLQSFLAAGTYIDNLVAAGRCDSADWQIPIREKPYLSLLLPEIQQCYQFGLILTTRARFDVLDQDLDSALTHIQASLALAKHLGQGPTIQNALTGYAVQRLSVNALLDYVSQETSPNLYWSLTTLPQPSAVSQYRALDAARSQLELTFPWFSTVLDDDLPLAEWEARLGEVSELFGSLGRRKALPTMDEMFIWGYPVAKQRLLDAGVRPEVVEKMPVAQVLLADFYLQDQIQHDRVLHWLGFPYWVASPKVTELQNAGKAQAGYTLDGFTTETRFDYGIFLSAKVQGEQQLAMLRVLEALRMVAAETGVLPATLEEIAYPPIPLDPVTGKSFGYTLHGDTALLEGTRASTAQWVNSRWEIKLAKQNSSRKE